MQAAPDPAAFMRRVWAVLLAAVLPLWRDSGLLGAHPRLLQSVASVMRNSMDTAATSAAATAASLAADARNRSVSAARSAAMIAPARVQRITEMGFSQAQAEAALRRVGGQVELALEWLFAHPDEPAAPEGGAAGGGPGGSEDDALARMVAEALSVDGTPMALLRDAGTGAEGSSAGAGSAAAARDAAAALPSSAALVSGAVDLAQAVPGSPFYLADMLKAYSVQSAENREVRPLVVLAAAVSGKGWGKVVGSHLCAVLSSGT